MKYIRVKCNSCGADSYTVLYNSNLKNSNPSVKEFTSTINEYATYNDIVKCNKCGLIYMNPRDEDVKNLYRDVVDEEYLNSWSERERTFKKHITWIKKYKKSGKILDIGCYAGIFPSVGEKFGFEVTGIEPSKWAVGYARKKTKSKLYQGSWKDIKFDDNSFDIVTIWDVIEHLEDPLGCLKTAYKWLRRDGVLMVTTHDINSLLAKIMGRKYPWLMRFHLYHFSPKTLLEMIKKSGFKDIKVTYYSKVFSLKYLLSRVGININSNLFSEICIPVWSGDMFMVTAMKI